MPTGKIKFFNDQKGYGFIEPEGGGKDVFVHISTVQKAGIDFLKEGDRVKFDILTDRGKQAAGNLSLIR